MLSVLIPIYNYNAYPLVREIHRQCSNANIIFEICCFDDASTSFTAENEQITTLSFCHVKKQLNNMGRSGIRNLLASSAKYDWLLFLDADVFPGSARFIKKYLDQITGNAPKVGCGGLLYQKEKPSSIYLLRWQYGKKREVIGMEKRQKKSNETLLFSNILIDKNTFLKVKFNEDILTYGYEDLAFGNHLKELKIAIKHIQNPVYHLHIDASEAFIEKTTVALRNLKVLIKEKHIGEKSTKLAKTYYYVKKFKMERLIRFFFLNTKPFLHRNLLSQTPSLFLFDLYKLGYFCTIDHRE